MSVFLLALALAASDVRVIDGDTINVPSSVVVGLPAHVSVRLFGVNAPELHGKCDKERVAAVAAKLYVADRFAKAKVITITYVQHDKYSRIDAHVNLDGADLAADLIAAKLAIPYTGAYRDPLYWCKTLP